MAPRVPLEVTPKVLSGLVHRWRSRARMMSRSTSSASAWL